jgi:hypothetical protein
VPDNPISTELQQFIARHIHSVEQIEILCVLSANTVKLWSVAEVFRQIQSSEASVLACLEEFREAALLKAEEGGYRFAPASAELANCISELIKAYHERRVTIIELIYKKPDTIQHFADAFRLRKEKEE